MESNEDFFKLFEEAIRKKELEFLVQYNESIRKIKDLFLDYSEKDILYSLFPLSLWLRNVASPVKLKLVYMIFCSIDSDMFKKKEKINKYKDYNDFVLKLISLFPNFYSLEDYIPEADWGEIKYCHNNVNYKIFYGCDIDGVYEFLESFQLIHCSLNDVYLKVCNRSPKFELEQSLILQQRIIENVKFNCSSEEIIDLSLGNIEVPSETFWKNCKEFYDSFDSADLPNEFLQTYSCYVGRIEESSFQSTNFMNSYFFDETFLFLFIKSGKKFYPVMPRRYISIMIESWGAIYRDNIDQIKNLQPNLNFIFNLDLYTFIKKRVRSIELFRILSPMDKEKHYPSESIYSCAFISKNELYLVYFIEPSYNLNQMEEKLSIAINNIENDLHILSQSPMTFLLRMEKEKNIMVFKKSDDDKIGLKLKTMIVIPRLRISLEILKPKITKSIIITLEDLLGIMDEIEDLDEISDFFNFIEDPQIYPSPVNSLLDIYGAYKDSFKILNPGASQTTSISIAPLYGSGYRYQTLEKFWRIYPEINFIDIPRTWKVFKEKEVVRLISKNQLIHVLNVKVGDSNIFINAPTSFLSWEHGRITDLLMEIIDDGLIMYKNIIKNHNVFKNFKKIQIFIFPFDAVKDIEQLSHLKKSDPEEKHYLIEYGLPESGILGIRVSFNYLKVVEDLMLSNDRQFEINLIKKIICTLNEICPNDIVSIIQTIEKDSINPPRFKINEFEKLASFPEFALVVEPEPNNFKSAKKSIAEIALENKINSGEYNLKDGKEILNRLKAGLVELINNKVYEFETANSLKYLISKADALTNMYETKRMVYKESIRHDVDYIREARYSSNHIKYINTHRNYRYLIEKFVQLSPVGTEHLNEDNLKELLGLIDWLHVIQYASDSIHYGISPVGIIVKEDFQVEVKYNEDFDSMEKLYSEEEAKINLEIKGNPKDVVGFKVENENYVNELDIAFTLDFKFSLKNLITVLEVLTYWPVHDKSIEECEYYQANLEKLYEVTISELISGTIDKDEFVEIINFLTLSKDNILFVIGNSKSCIDLPIWEHSKRPMRYSLRPLIKINDDYIWGSFSVKKTSEIWRGNLSIATFPFDTQMKNVRKVLKKEKEIISNKLNIKAEEIIKRFTGFVRMKFEIFKIDRTNSALQALGDFDVLALLPDKNILLNIECKDIKPPFCVKDTMTLRERIFGKNNKDKGYFDRVINRELYLKKNADQILDKLKWNYIKNENLEILTLFITPRNYWWTKFPPFKTDVIFLRIDLLEDFIKDLK